MNAITINSLAEDTQATNAIRQYRRSIGSTQKPRNAYNWWQVSIAILTYCDQNDKITINLLEKAASDYLGMKFNFFSTLLIRAAEGEAPSNVRREYAKSLPCLAQLCDLDFNRQKSTGGRPAFYFWLNRPKTARNHLLTTFPGMLTLFMELDRVFIHGK